MKLFPENATMRDVIRERRSDAAEVEVLRVGKLDGRIRTSRRAAPSAFNNVIAGDAEGDVITDATYVYTLYRVSGTLVWDRRSLSIGW